MDEKEKNVMEETPILINSVDEFLKIKDNLSGSYKLAVDIDLDGKTPEAIGTSSKPFEGSFDGDGHCIKNIVINASTSYIGLFGYGKNAVIKNIEVENAIVKNSSSYVGVLAGYLSNCIVENIYFKNITVSSYQSVGTLAGYVDGGKIFRCGAGGNISVSGSFGVGGLLGRVYGNAEVQECYSVSGVTGLREIGGLIGSTNAKICNCFARGSVSSDKDYEPVAGLVGYAFDANIKNCYAACKVNSQKHGLVFEVKNVSVVDSYFDNLVAEIISKDIYGVGKLTPALLTKETFNNWDFEKIWKINEKYNYPCLKNAKEPLEQSINIESSVKGSGNSKDPYLIESAEGVLSIQYDLAGFYVLTSDVDFEDKSINPMGERYTPFKGSLDGNGYCIKGFRMNMNSSGMGLFVHVQNAEIKNLRMENIHIKQIRERVGGILTGYLTDSVITNVHLENVKLEGTEYVGGMAGYAEGGMINECSVNGNIAGDSYIGGLFGYAGVELKNSFVRGSVISDRNSGRVGGLIGYASLPTIKNCYAACVISNGGEGLVSGFGDISTISSYFDSDLSGIVTPKEQARTTEQMYKKETYVDWEMENVWLDKENNYPGLRTLEIVKQEISEISYRNLTSTSVILTWMPVSVATEYDIRCMNQEIKSLMPEVGICDLAVDTEYEIFIRARLGELKGPWSKTLRIRTKKISTLNGVHCTEKKKDSMELQWNPVDDAISYEVLYNNNIHKTDTNTCTLTGLSKDVPYAVSIRAIMADGSVLTSNSITEKMFTLDPQTDYAKEFIEKCESQAWFIDEIENMLNLKGKSVNTINSQKDLATIYVMNLTNRGISGQIPTAIGELVHLKYLYLADNKLSGKIPDEMKLLKELVKQELSGNQFSE